MYHMTDIFTAATQLIQPALLGFLARVPLDNEPGAVFNQNPKFFGGIIAGVHPDQQWFPSPVGCISTVLDKLL